MPEMTLEEKVDSILERLDSIEQGISKLTLREFVQPTTVTFIPAQRCSCGLPGTSACPLHGYMGNFTVM